MARGEQKGNREKKKPKQVKAKEAAPASPFAAQTKAGNAERGPAKKK